MRVVIVGGGFAGVRAALNLANKPDFEVKLLSTQSFFEYHAALYRSATGRSPLEVAIPLKDFFAYAHNVEIVEDAIDTLDIEARLATGVSGSRFPYDALILALGNVTEYYGIEGLKEYSYGVKSIHEALRLKRHLHDQLVDEQAERHYVVVGAGATGIELAAEMTAYLRNIRRKHKINRDFSIDLIEAGPRPAGLLPESYSRVVERRLRELGVKLQVNTTVKSEDVEGIMLQNRKIKTHTVVWTAGVTNNPFFLKYPEMFQLGRAKRVQVDEYLQASEGVFVIGDSADTQYSGMAQTALHDANFVTKNLELYLRGLQPKAYKAKRPIYAIPVGKRWAAVLWGRTQINGKPGWVLRRMADLRLYLRFLTFTKALTAWRYGFIDHEVCPICKK